MREAQPSQNKFVEVDGQLTQFVPTNVRGYRGYELKPYTLEPERKAKRTDKDRAKSKAAKAARKKNRG